MKNDNENPTTIAKYLFSKKVLVYSIFVVGIVCLMIITQCQMKEHLSDTLRIEINTQTTTPLRKELYGFNTNMMSGDYGYLDTDFVELTKALMPQTLRFPGGTVGNFYHWERAGFIQEEMTSTLNTQLNKRNKGNYVKLQKRRNGRISFDEFMELCNKLTITPIVVVNLWTGSPDESAAWVRYSKEKGYNILHWELGNEYYLPHYLNKYPTAQVYLKAAKKHALAMKAVDPEIKVSICATPVAFHEEGFLIKTPQRMWDKQLASETNPNTTDWYDAYSVHVYAYKAMKDVDIEEMRGYLFGWINYGIDQALDYYQKLFPNKEMWVTEWNIANPANRVANTQLHAMYAGDFFLKMLSTPKITHANFHVITGPGKGFPVFSRITPPSERTFWKYGGEPESDYGDTIRRTVYFTFQLLGNAIAESDIQMTVSLRNVPTVMGGLDYKGKQIQGMQVQTIGNKDYAFLLISNRTDSDLSPQLLIDGKRIKKQIILRHITNETLSATNGGNAAMEGYGKMEVQIQEWSGRATELIIPQNTFAVLEVRI